MIAARARSNEGQTFVEGFTRSWGDPQPGAFAPLFAPEIRLVAPLLPVTEGITAAEKAFKRLFAVFKGMRGEVHDWAPHPDGVFIDVVRWGRGDRSLYIESHCQAMVTGRLLRWPQVDRFHLSDGRIGTISAFLDTFPLASRLGRSKQARQQLTELATT